MTSAIETPVGFLEVSTSEKGLISVAFADKTKSGDDPSTEVSREAIQQLTEYMAGQRQTFTVPLDLKGTEFQKKVWQELIKIPYGNTISYLELAKRLGDEKSIRAAASANGKNPIAIIVPCHRVIGLHGDLVGYAGGLHRKKWLLQHEGALDQLELFNS